MAGGIRESDDLDEAHEINVTPFIDVMLVLLIIFMVAAPLSTVDVPVSLPTAGAPPAQRPDQPLIVTLQADLALSFGNAPVTRAALAATIRNAAGPQAPDAPQGPVIAFARPDELRIHAQPQENAIQATFLREVWIAGKVLAELNDRQGNLIEISLTPDEAKLHQFRPNQTVWLSASALHLFENQAA